MIHIWIIFMVGQKISPAPHSQSLWILPYMTKYIVMIKDFEIVTLAWIIQVGPKYNHMCLHKRSIQNIDPERKGNTQRHTEKAVCPQRQTLEWYGWSQEQLAATGSWKKQEVDSPLGPSEGGRPADTLIPNDTDLGEWIMYYHKQVPCNLWDTFKHIHCLSEVQISLGILCFLFAKMQVFLLCPQTYHDFPSHKSNSELHSHISKA